MSQRVTLAFMQLLLNDIQDIVFQSVGSASTHEEVRDKVRGLVCKSLAVRDCPFSLRRRPSGQARAKEKERLKETAKEAAQSKGGAKGGNRQ